MPIDCSCQSCQADFRIAREYAGQRVRCPKCGNALDVPSTRAESSVPEARSDDEIPVAVPVLTADSVAELQAEGLVTGPTSATERMRQLHHQRSSSTKLFLLLALVGLMLAAAFYGGYLLYAKQQLRPGTLVLDGDAMNLSDVLVVVDGERLGMLSGEQTRFDVEPGDHLLVLKRRGFGPIEKTFHVGRGDEWHMNPVWVRPAGFPLEPLEPELNPTPANEDAE